MNTTADHRISQASVNEFLLHLDSLYSFALKLTSNEENARDLVQDAYLRALRYVEHYTPGTNARAWLFKLMYNQFVNDYRRKQNSPLVEIDEDSQGNSYYERPISPEVFNNTLSDEVVLAFNHLKSDLKAVIYLRDFESLKYDEISKVLDIPVCTVKTRIHRGRTLMRQSLAKSGFFSRNN
ncbi:MAG: RNA polymerase sigma factor [Bacteroidota bacterium]